MKIAICIIGILAVYVAGWVLGYRRGYRHGGDAVWLGLRGEANRDMM